MDRDVGAGLVQHYVPGVLLQKEHLARDGEAPNVKEERLKKPEAGGVGLGGAVHRGEDEEQDSERNGPETEDQQGVRWADNLDVETVSVVPPVVKGSSHEHGDASPPGEEDAERGAKSKDTDRCITELAIVAEGAVNDQPGADDSGENTTGVDGHVRWGPESIAADGSVP